MPTSFLVRQNWRVDFHSYVEQINLESEEHKMRKKDLIAENKKLKDEVEDLKRQLTYAKTQIDIKDICLMLNKEREVYHD